MYLLIKKTNMPEISPQRTVDLSYQERLVESPYDALLQKGYERAGKLGYDLNVAMQSGYDEGIDAGVMAVRTEAVRSTSVEMAEVMQLKPEFFDRPINTIMLSAIAESWVSNEERAAEPNVDRNRIASERDTLVDIASMLAGEDSATLQDLGLQDSYSKDRYLEEIYDPELEARDDFLDAHVNVELSNYVQSVLNQRGEGSFLYDQRTALGLDEETEEPFVVKVLDMATGTDMYSACVQPVPEWPNYDRPASELTEDEKAERKRKGDEANDIYEANKAQTDKLTKVEDEYMAKFGERFGMLPGAFVSKDQNGKIQMFLRAPHAMALRRYFKNEVLPSDENAARNIGDIFATIRHEFGHTQKNMTIGPHVQLGLILEERKAEFVSGDQLGYQDIKGMMSDLSLATDTRLLTDVLASSLKDEDPVSSFAAHAANKIGLRNVLLLMALKPLPYERSLDHAKKFANLKPVQVDADASSLDIPIRETLARKGDKVMDKGIDEWMRGIDESIGLTDFHEDFLPSHRERLGLGISARKIGEAVHRIRNEKPKAA